MRIEPSLIAPNAVVEIVVLDGLCDIGGLDTFLPVKIGNGSGDLENAVVGPGRKPKLFHGIPQKPLEWFAKLAILAKLLSKLVKNLNITPDVAYLPSNSFEI